MSELHDRIIAFVAENPGCNIQAILGKDRGEDEQLQILDALDVLIGFGDVRRLVYRISPTRFARNTSEYINRESALHFPKGTEVVWEEELKNED